MPFNGLQTTVRNLGSISYQASQKGSLDLDTDSVLLASWLRLQATLTNGAGALVGPKWNVLARLLRSIEFQIQGREEVISLDGEGALMFALKDFGTLPEGAADPFVVTPSVTTDYDLWIPIAHFLPRSQSPLLTALDLRGINQASLVVLWGTPVDLADTVTNLVVDSASVTLVGEYLDNVPGDQAFLVRNLDSQTAPVTGNDANFNITLDKGTGLAYRSFNLVTLRDEDLVSDILDGNTVKLLSGNQNFKSSPAEFWAAHRKSYRALDNELPGVYNIETPWGGDSAQMIPTNTLDADLRLNMGVTFTSGTEKIANYRESVRPLIL